MDINDVFPTKFLKAHDLQGREPVVTIARVECEPMGGRSSEIKAIVYFAGKEKGLKLNKTMATKISQIAGSPKTEAWIGIAVQLYASTADFGGETFAVVRIKAPTARAPQLARPQPPPPVVRSTDPDSGPLALDDIPF